MHSKVEFNDVAKFAQFCAELTRQGIRFRGYQLTNGWEFVAEITG